MYQLLLGLSWSGYAWFHCFSYKNTTRVIWWRYLQTWQTFWCCEYSSLVWWRHQMEIFSALLFPSQRPVTRILDVFFDLRPNKRLRKQSWGWLFETRSRPLWRYSNGFICFGRWKPSYIDDDIGTSYDTVASHWMHAQKGVCLTQFVVATR